MIVDVLKTPRGMIYAALTLLLIVHWAFGIGWFVVIAVIFLVIRLIQAWSEQFGCPKCLIGLASAGFMGLGVIFGFSFQIFILTFVTMWVDAWLHGSS